MTAPKLSELLVFYGGRFDPPHLGHEEVVKELKQESKHLKIIPSGYSPYKPSVASPLDRLEMAKRAFGSSIIDSREIKRTLKESSSQCFSLVPTYTIETLKEIKQEVLETPFSFVIGSDQLKAFTTWRDYQALLLLCHWVVLRRKGGPEPLEILREFETSGLVRKHHSQFQLLNGKTTLQVYQTEARGFSSTSIRKEIALTGSLVSGSLSPSVESYLKEKKLYGIL